MIKREENGIPYYTFKELDDPKFSFVRYAVSTRRGGVSKGETLGTLNMGTRTGDNMENVKENYRIFLSALSLPAERVVLGNQTHSLNVRAVSEKDAGKGIFRARDYTDVDALITNEKNLPLCIHTADCVPVTLIDIKNKAVGNAHCGWRGTLGRLSAVMLSAMKEAYGTDFKDVTALIGPCIHKCCYEVSEDLYETFLKEFHAIDLVFKKNDKFYLDLPNLNRLALEEAGVPTVLVSDICTCCNKDGFYSHRGLGPKRGVFSTFVCKIKD